MAKQEINVGIIANDGTGDRIRNAFIKVNANFNELYQNVSTLTSFNLAGITDLNFRTNAAFNTANAAYNFANTISTTSLDISGLYAVVNASFNKTNSAYSFANTVFSSYAEPALTYSIAAFDAANASVKLTAPSQTITGDLAITGNLYFTGNAVVITANTLEIGDSLIYLSANNYTGTDTLPIGFIGNYGNTSGANVHTGLVRNPADKEYYLFNNYDIEPGTNNQINFGSNNMTTAVLNADLVTGNLWLGGTNTIPWITSAFAVSNSAFDSANLVGIVANAVFQVSNAAFGVANTANSRPSPYDVGGFVYGKTLSSEIIFQFNVVRNFTIAANCLGSTSNCGIAASANAVFTINKNSVNVGTMLYETGLNSATFNTSGNILYMNVGDYLSVTAPATPDATLANFSFTFKGTLS